MTANKRPMQANGGGETRHEDGISDPHGREGSGESGGGAYPNPHDSTRSRNKFGSFLGRGGQTEPDYFGPERKVRGDKPVEKARSEPDE